MSVVKADIALFGTTLTALNAALIAHRDYHLKVVLFTEPHLHLIAPQHISVGFAPEPHLNLWPFFHALFLSDKYRRNSGAPSSDLQSVDAHALAFRADSRGRLKRTTNLLNDHNSKCTLLGDVDFNGILQLANHDGVYGHLQHSAMCLDPIKQARHLLSQIQELDIDVISLDQVRHVEKRPDSFFVELDVHPFETDHAAFLCDQTVAQFYGHQIRQMRPKTEKKSTLISSQNDTLAGMALQIKESDIQLFGTSEGQLLINGPGDAVELGSKLISYLPSFAELPLVATRCFEHVIVPDKLPCIGTYRPNDAFVAFGLGEFTGLLDDLITHQMIKTIWPEKADLNLLDQLPDLSELFSPRRFEKGQSFSQPLECSDTYEISNIVGLLEEASDEAS